MDENGHHGHHEHLLFVWSPSGWTLRLREGDAPPVGATLEDGDKMLRVTKIGSSPLPGDRRPCAYTELA